MGGWNQAYGSPRVGADELRRRPAPGRRRSDACGGPVLEWGTAALLIQRDGLPTTGYTRSRDSQVEAVAEIGLRRSLGATREQIRLQFLAESLLLSTLGGLGGVLLGTALTTGYAAYQTWPAVVPAWATAGGLAATMLIGGLAGLYPAIRAARLSPTEALATP
jgi:putative ABC transport system permease protein